MFEVDAAAFCHALLCILPHAEPSEKDVEMHRIQLRPSGARQLLVVAGSTTSWGVMRIDLQETSMPIPVDLTPKDAANIAKIFAPGKNESTQLRIESAGGQITISEVGLLLDGRSLKLPVYNGDKTRIPDLASKINGFLMLDPTPRPVTELLCPGFSAMAATAARLERRLVVESTVDNGPLLVRIGSYFIGLMAATRDDAESGAERVRDKIREEWFLRLPSPDGGSVLRYGSGVITAPRRSAEALDPSEFRELLAQAADLAVVQGFASKSMLQRSLRVSMDTAGKILDDLEEQLVVRQGEDGISYDVLVPDQDREDVVGQLRRGEVVVIPNRTVPELDMDLGSEYLRTAAEIVLTSQWGSTSTLQRKLRVGYQKAKDLMDQLEKLGVVSAPQGSRSRQVLMPADALPTVLAKLDELNQKELANA